MRALAFPKTLPRPSGIDGLIGLSLQQLNDELVPPGDSDRPCCLVSVAQPKGAHSSTCRNLLHSQLRRAAVEWRDAGAAGCEKDARAEEGKREQGWISREGLLTSSRQVFAFE